MIYRRSSILSFMAGLLAVATTCHAQDKKVDPAQAMRDMQIGMSGLKQAGEDPEMLAQLMRDMQDPELMKEAQKMMADPAWQKEMKKISNSKDFKSSVKQTKDMLADPDTAAHAEARMEHMLKVGENEIKKSATGAMEEAMANMANPEVMAEMTKMLKDPNFAKQFEAMQKDPSFKSYVDAMGDMMKDPAKKKKLEAVTQAVKANL